MPGLIPDLGGDQTIGDASAAAGDRFDGQSGQSDRVPVATPTSTVVTIDGDKITIIEGAQAESPKKSDAFDDNLAEFLDPGALGAIATELLEGIESDIRAREGFIANYEKGLDYLGLKMTTQSAVRGRRSTAKVFHPALQWACVKFQAGARGELLPSAGPCKVRVDGGEDADIQTKAFQLEQDINHYLTVGAPEYYPDMDQGLFYLAFGGQIYKKVYRCPTRQRPVADVVTIKDLVVSNEASNLATAQRITQIIPMLDHEVRQMMSLDMYRDVALTTPVDDMGRIDKKERETMGRRPTADRPQDTQRTIYECYCFLDLSRWGHDEDGQPSSGKKKSDGFSSDLTGNIPIPYRVAIDRDSRTVLEIRRNWREQDTTFQRRRMFIKYGLIPGMGGSLDYGYLHLIGNMTQALTALLRMVIDSGMFASFPGGIRLKGARADTNEINPGPGEFAELDVPVDDIKKAIMAMPYKDPSGVLLQLIQYLEGQVKTIQGAVEFSAGEGKTNIPVGSMMAMIEQQTQVMMAVHKRLHTAQAEELIALKDLFAEYPEDIVKYGSISGVQWSAEDFQNAKLVPQSDPNIPSQIHRLMQSQAIALMVQQDPGAFNKNYVYKSILQNLGRTDADAILAPPQTSAPPPDPKVQEKQADMQMEQMEQQAAMQKVQAEGQIRLKELDVESQDRAADRASREQIANMKLDEERLKTQAMAANRQPAAPGGSASSGATGLVPQGGLNGT